MIEDDNCVRSVTEQSIHSSDTCFIRIIYLNSANYKWTKSQESQVTHLLYTA